MGNQIATLKQELMVAKLRSKCLWFTYATPDEFRGTSSAYGSGYEAGWRGWEYQDPYNSLRHSRAYRNGYADANVNLHMEALKQGEAK